VSELSWDVRWQSSGPLGAILGGLKKEKMQTVLRENHFFESRLLALGAPLGSLSLLQTPPGPILGPRWLPNDPQKLSKIGSKNGPRFSPVLGCSWTHFGARFGVQNSCTRGDTFSSFSSKIKTSLETFVFFMLPWVCVFWCFFGGRNVKSRPRSKHSSFSCFRLGTHVVIKHPSISPSYPGMMVKFSGFWWRHECLSWAHLGPILSPLGFMLASFWPHLGPLGLSCRRLGALLALFCLSVCLSVI